MYLWDHLGRNGYSPKRLLCPSLRLRAINWNWNFPRKGEGKAEAWCSQGRSLSPGKRFHCSDCQTNLSFVRQGSGIQAVTGRWWAGLCPDQDCLVLYPRLLFKPKLHVGTSKMDLTSLFVPLSNVAILNKVLLPPLLWFLWLLVSLIDPLRISSSLGLPTPGSDFNNINDIGWSFRLCSGSGNSLVHQSYLFGFTLLE